MNLRIRVFVCDDHCLFREGVKTALQRLPSFDVVGEAAGGRDAIEKVRELSPDVVLMDVSMPDIPGFEATAQIRESNPSIKVVILSMHNTEEFLTRCLEAGATGYVTKETSIRELAEAIETVHRGEEYFSPAVLKKVVTAYLKNYRPPQTAYDRLSERERQILGLLAEGLTVRETALRLNLSTKTVDAHKYNLMRKIDVHDRAALVKYAVQEKARRAPAAGNPTGNEIYFRQND